MSLKAAWHRKEQETQLSRYCLSHRDKPTRIPEETSKQNQQSPFLFLVSDILEENVTQRLLMSLSMTCHPKCQGLQTTRDYAQGKWWSACNGLNQEQLCHYAGSQKITQRLLQFMLRKAEMRTLGYGGNYGILCLLPPHPVLHFPWVTFASVWVWSLLKSTRDKGWDMPWCYGHGVDL